MSAITEDRASIAELERRRRKAGMLKKTREQRAATINPVEIREADDGSLTLVGIACRTSVEYDVGWYREIILPEAFRRTLSENPDVQLVVNHAAGGQLPLARTRSGTMTLELVDEGLEVRADLDPEDPDVQSLVRKLKRGDVDGMSFAFMVHEGGDSWNDDLSVRTIRSLSLHRGDVSVVNQGANPLAYATVRSQEAVAALSTRSRTDLFDALYEVRVGKTLSAATVEILTQVLSLTGDAEEASGDARALLDGLINPDTEDEAGDSVERSIDSEKGLHAAIRSVLRTPGEDERRAEIAKRAAELDLSILVPGDWTADGALPEGRALTTTEQRETFNDTYTALDGALHEMLVTNGDCYYVWVQDFTDTEVIYYAHGDLYSAPYTLVPGGEVSIGEGVKVRPVTEYVERAAKPPVPVTPLPDFTTRARQQYDLLRLGGKR